MKAEPITTDIPEFPTLPQAARLLGVSINTIRAAARRGELPLYRVGTRWWRVRWSEAIAWVQSKRRPVKDVPSDRHDAPEEGQ